jgi:tetratricopeptide (TPR) repeat protein
MTSRRVRSSCLSALVVLTVSLAAAAQPPASDPVALVAEARKLNEAGQQRDAIALYERALQHDETSFDAHLGIGMALDLVGDYARARRHLQKAIDMAPAESLASALSAMGVSWAFEANAREAAPYYRRLFDRRMEAGDLGAAAATANAVARVYLESGDLDPAEHWYDRGYDAARRLTGLPPEQVDLWELRYRHAQARLAVRRGYVAEAERLANIVKRIVDKGGPNERQRPTYQYLVGYIAFHAKRYDAAVMELGSADQRDPFILGLIAQAWEAKGAAARAHEFFAKALESNAHTIQNAFSRPTARARLAAR